MDEREARQVLGVAAGAGPDEVRSAFRRRIRAGHPDVAGAVGAPVATRVIEAYRVLQARPAPVTSLRSPPEAGQGSSGVAVSGDCITIVLPPGLALAAVMELADGLGEIAYVDRSAGLVEAIVDFDGWPVCSVLFDASHRSNGGTEVTVAVVALSGGPAPPEEAVAALAADRLRRLVLST